jgi:hypothetical protein
MDDETAKHEFPNMSDNVGRVPHTSDEFGRLQTRSDTVRTGPQKSDRKESHTLTVQEVARMFERAGVPRTERSVIRWCQPNRQGIAKLDCYFDPNERKYLITPDSVELAIKEEQHRAERAQSIRNSGEVGHIPTPSEAYGQKVDPELSNEPARVKILKQEIMDLKITNRAKDMFIEEIRKERDGFALERQGYVEKLMTFNRKVGQLETRLLQIAGRSGEQSTPEHSDDLDPGGDKLTL